MAWSIFLQPMLFFPLIVLNMVTMHWVRQRQYGRRVGLTGNNVFLSLVSAGLAIAAGMMLLPFQFLESLVVIFAIDVLLLMVWVLWSVVYLKGEHYPS